MLFIIKKRENQVFIDQRNKEFHSKADCHVIYPISFLNKKKISKLKWWFEITIIKHLL